MNSAWKWSAALFIAGSLFSLARAAESFRPPAVPLIANDPYLSIWSESNLLTDDVTRHWTGYPQALSSLIRIDGKTYRLMGSDPHDVPAFPQTGLEVTPTRSIYQFADGHIHVTLTFMTAALPAHLDILARPLSYITWAVKSDDGRSHAVSIYDSTSSALAVNMPDQTVTWQRGTAGPLTTLRFGTLDQVYFEPRGDDKRIDWGYAYAAAPTAQTTSCIGITEDLARGFANNGTIPPQDATPPHTVKDGTPVMAFVFDLGSVGTTEVSRHVIVAYDEIYAIKLSGENLVPYWKRDGATIVKVLQSAESDYPQLAGECATFDRDLMTDLTKAGGGKYAQICALAYRQCLAGTGLAADRNKQPLLFTKENTSNGDIATVDVFYPMDPMFLLLSPTLAKASVVPILQYAASSRWKFPNAPHDMGAYPVASATGEASEEMPVEESSNMLLLCDAIVKSNGDINFVKPWWHELTKWAGYLKQYGLDPENQLCTDDFMGHLAHNSNLSVKAILALAAYGDMCARRGEDSTAANYRDMAKKDAENWMKVAAEGDHYRLAFDRPHTWSQLYNLVWDKILGLNIFPPSVAQKEVAFYKTMILAYGLPLDSRTTLTKTDWSVWTATLADNLADFELFINPIYNLLNETSARQPLADSYMTNDPTKGGFHARPVVGGLFIRMLSDEKIWKKWASADTTKTGNWAPLRPLPTISLLFPPNPQKPLTWRYTTTQPAADWNSATFDDSTWKQGKLNDWMPAQVNPSTYIPDVWMRTKITLPKRISPHLEWVLNGRSDGEIYINGVRAGTGSYHDNPEPEEIDPVAKVLLKPRAQIVIAAHMHGGYDGQTAITLGNVWP